MNASAVAEQAVLLMLGVLRDVCGGDRSVRAGRQIETKEQYMIEGNLTELSECTVGLIGFGDIGKSNGKSTACFWCKGGLYKEVPCSAGCRNTLWRIVFAAGRPFSSQRYRQSARTRQ